MIRSNLKSYWSANDNKHMGQSGDHQKGVVLIVVLLLTASLSFIALGITSKMTETVKRTSASNGLATLHWRAISVEPIAKVAIERTFQVGRRSGGVTLTPLTPLFLRPVIVPLPSGSADIAFVDASRCFNLNSLQPASAGGGSNAVQDENDPNANNSQNDNGFASAANQQSNQRENDTENGTAPPISGSPSQTSKIGFIAPTAKQEFISLASALGMSESTASTLVAVIRDWIDPDLRQEQFGAEDDFYTTLPTPFRTGGGLLADVSEIRAMVGVNRDVYLRLRSYLCVRPDRSRSVINVNMLQPRDAPLLVALTGGEIRVNEAQDIIERRPPGGWESLDRFWSQGPLSRLKTSSDFRRARSGLSSNFIGVQARLSINELDMVNTLLFYVSGQTGQVKLISRQFGAPS